MSTTGLSADQSEPIQPEVWWRTQKWRAFFALGLSFFVIVWSTTMTYVLLPDIAEHFDVTLGAVGWVVIIEALIISALLLPFGGLADAFGRKRFLIAGMSVFAAGSIATGLAPSFVLLIVARAAMSVGNAMIQAVGTAALVAAFPPQERGMAMGAQAISVSIGAASGPLIGGFAVAYVDWSTLFVLLAVPSLVAVAGAVAFLTPDDPNIAATCRSADPVGALLSALAVVALIVTISDPWGFGLTGPTLALAAATLVLIVGFVTWELRNQQPLIDVRLFTLPVVKTASIVRSLGFSATTTIQLLLPVLLVSVRGASSGTAGIVAAMIAVGMAFGAQIGGQIYDRIGPRRPSVAGLIAQTILLGTFGWADADSSVIWLGALALASGFAQNIWNVPNNSALMGAPPTAALGVMGAFTNVNRTMGNVFGQALSTSIIVSVLAADGFDIPLDELADTPGAAASFLDGWWIVLMTAAGLSAVAAAFASRLPKSRTDTIGS
ncbi:MAG: MFS family permease [Candidatus Poriferisodalaceae bacterium]|jgi:MFS family permease